jgi:hypothetical protein
MKETILKLRDEGKTYSEIQKIIGCSKGTISYHCGQNQKIKTKIRRERLRELNVLIQKVDSFKRKISPIRHRVKKFNKKGLLEYEKNFCSRDVLKKFGQETKCYLSGLKVDILIDKDYHFDHIIPPCQGGTNTLDNLGILKNRVNVMKSDMSVDELLNWCKIILEHNGFIIVKQK